jgi:hypothetical protein
MSIWEKFDKSVDVAALKEDAKQAAENNQEFREVPNGKYEVKIQKLELAESKAGKPMLSCWMKILDGDYKGSLIFYNQVLNVGFGIHNANEFLRSLDSGIEVSFESFKQYAQLLMDIHEVIDGKSEFELEYGENNKGYKTYKIVTVFEAA